jgi:hypothetical protein
MVFVADHGESLVEHQQLLSHQFSLYEPVVRVPLIVRDPGRPAAALGGAMSTTRVAATLLELGGLEPAEPMAPSLLSGVGPQSVSAVGAAPLSPSTGPRARPLQVMVRQGGRKVVLAEGGHVERYGLGPDPLEQWPLLLEAEQRALEAWIRDRVEASPRRTPGLGFLPALQMTGHRSTDRRAGPSLTQPGVLGVRLDPSEAAEWAVLTAEARRTLEGARAARKALRSERAVLPDEAQRGLEALGYVH